MVRSTVDYYAFTVKTRKKNPDIPRDVLDVGGGYSVLAYLCSYLEHVKGCCLLPNCFVFLSNPML